MKLLDYLNQSTMNQEECITLDSLQEQKLKECLLHMYVDIMSVCKRYNLTCMLSGGSALGAIRHDGFIPWDDDMDLMMPRSDYDKFQTVFVQDMNDEYYLISPTSSKCNYFVQVIRRGTTVKYLNQVDETGVKIDIFPIDAIHNNHIMNYVTHHVLILLRGIIFSIRTYKSRDRVMRDIMAKHVVSNVMYYVAFVIGFIFSGISLSYWCRLCDRIMSSGKSISKITIAPGRKTYLGEILPRTVFFPPRKCKFEKEEAYIPNDIKYYLTNLYDDYMTIPPIADREKHAYVKFDLGD